MAHILEVKGRTLCCAHLAGSGRFHLNFVL